MTKRTVLLTGGSGFIGSQVLQTLSQDQDLSIIAHYRHKPRQCGTVPMIHQALHSEEFAQLDLPCHTVIHAAYAHNNPELNREILSKLIVFCRRNGVKHLVQLSSVSVYEIPMHGELDEQANYAASNDPYVRTKIALERQLSLKAADLNVTILQPTVVFGNDSNWSKTACFIAAHQQITLPLAGRGCCNYVYINDLANIIAQIVKRNPPNGQQKFLVSSPEPCDWRQFIQAHSELLGVAMPVVKAPNNQRKYHDHALKNAIMHVFYDAPMVGDLLFKLLATRVKQQKQQCYQTMHLSEVLQYLQRADINQSLTTYCPQGLTRRLMASQSQVSSAQLQTLYPVKFLFTLEQAIANMADVICGQKR